MSSLDFDARPYGVAEIVPVRHEATLRCHIRIVGDVGSRYESHQGLEDVLHGAGRLSRSRLFCPPASRSVTQDSEGRHDTKSAKDVPGGGEENTRAAGLAPDMLIAGAGQSPVVIPRMECFVVDHQLAVKQIQFFDSGMAMRRIRSPRCEPYKHADTVFLCVRRKQVAGDARRHFFPFRFKRSMWR